MKLRYMIISILIALSSCMGDEGTAMTDSSVVSSAKDAIGLCLDEYVQQTGGERLDEVGYVNVHANARLFGVIFRSSRNDGTLFSCGVQRTAEPKIYFMGAPSARPIIKSDDADIIDQEFYRGDVIEITFRREGPSFNYLETRSLQVK